MKTAFFILAFTFSTLIYSQLSESKTTTAYYSNGKSVELKRYNEKRKALKLVPENGDKFEIPYSALDSLVTIHTYRKDPDEKFVRAFVRISERNGSLMVWEVKGDSNLYSSYRVGFNTRNTTYYVQRKDEAIATKLCDTQLIPGIAFKKTAAEYFSDCPKLVEKIKDRDFKRRKPIPLIKYYNENCN